MCSTCVYISCHRTGRWSLGCQSPICQFPVPHSLVAARSVAGYRMLVSGLSVAVARMALKDNASKTLSIPVFLKGDREHGEQNQFCGFVIVWIYADWYGFAWTLIGFC